MTQGGSVLRWYEVFDLHVTCLPFMGWERFDAVLGSVHIRIPRWVTARDPVAQAKRETKMKSLPGPHHSQCPLVPDQGMIVIQFWYTLLLRLYLQLYVIKIHNETWKEFLPISVFLWWNILCYYQNHKTWTI